MTEGQPTPKRPDWRTGNRYARKHDGWNTPEWHSWQAMLARCYRPTATGYERYGGRGITVCDRWRESFANFLVDVGKRPTPTDSLERIDNTGNYEPGNVRWATKTEQACNRRSNRLITHNGQTKLLKEWAEEAGVSLELFSYRLKAGWDFDRAMTTPANHYVRKKTP